MKTQKKEKSTRININSPTSQKHNTDLEKKLYLENAKVFKQIFGIRPPKIN
jgi:hypothetical protein